MFPKWVPILSLATMVALTACSRKPPPKPDQPQKAAAEAYDVSPQVLAARLAGATETLDGVADPGAAVRLAIPGGQAWTGLADAKGRWRLVLPAASQARIFGLSELAHGRRVQAQGYVLLGPRGEAALLRAGTGAVRLDPAAGPRLGAVDFDQEGGAVVSGTAPPHAWLSLRLDGRQAAEGRADAEGRYVIALNSVAPGVHGLAVVGDGFTDQSQVTLSPAAPLVGGPMRSQLSGGGLRVDWLTPGGGEQTTILLD